MVKSNRQKLRELYPDMKSYETAVKKYGSQRALAAELGICSSDLSVHKRWIKNGSKSLNGRNPKYAEPNGRVMDAAIKALALAGGSRNTVKVYRATEEYKPGQTGYEGLEFVEERPGMTWVEVGHMVNPRSAKRALAGFTFQGGI